MVNRALLASLVVLLASLSVQAQNVNFPTAQTLVLPTGWTTAGTSKATTTACALATSYAMKNGNSGVTGGYVPLVVEQPGLIAQLWGHVLGYFGPGKDFSGEYPLTAQQIVGSWFEQKTWGTGARYITATVVDWGSLAGNTCASQLVQGYDGTIAPWRSFVTGKFYRRYDVEQQNTFCNTCSPALACGTDGNDGEVWASLWSNYTCSIELVTELPVGAKVLLTGAGDIGAGFTQPYPDNYGSIPGQSEDGITSSYPQAETALDEYLDEGSITLENGVDVTSVTIVGDTGYPDNPVTYEADTTIITSVTIHNNISFSTAEIVVELESINDKLEVFVATLSTGAIYNQFQSVVDSGTYTSMLIEMSSAAISQLQQTEYFQNLQNLLPPDVSSTTVWEPCFTFAWSQTSWKGQDQSVCMSMFPGWDSFVLPLIQWALFFITCLWSLEYMWKD